MLITANQKKMENLSKMQEVNSNIEGEKFEKLKTLLENPHYDSIKEHIAFVESRKNEPGFDVAVFKMGDLTEMITQLESGSTGGHFDTPLAKAQDMFNMIDPRLGHNYNLKVDVEALKNNGLDTESAEVKALISYIEVNSRELISDMVNKGNGILTLNRGI